MNRVVGTALAAACGVAVATLAVGSATAAIVTVTYTGTVYNSYDSTGLFGTRQSSLDGDAYIAKYVYDTSVGNRIMSPGLYDEIFGGSSHGVMSPVSGSVTINGVTETIGGDYEGIAAAWSTFYSDEVQNYSANLINYSIESDAYRPYTSSPSLNDVYPLTAAGTEGTFQFHSYNALTGAAEVNTYGYFEGGTVQVSEVQVSAVPENATWALMLIGLGGAGAGLRARRKAILPA